MAKIIKLPSGKEITLKENEGIVYKVVVKKKEKLFSLFVDNEFMLTYHLNEKCKPEIGKIFAYSNLNEAHCSGGPIDSKIVILISKGVNPIQIKNRPYNYRSIYIKDFWEFFNTDKSLKILNELKINYPTIWHCSIQYANDSTTLCDYIIPLEVIK